MERRGLYYDQPEFKKIYDYQKRKLMAHTDNLFLKVLQEVGVIL